MRIAILGTGMVGRGLAARFADLGHSVTVGTRDPERSTTGDGEYALWLAGEPTIDTRTFAEAAAAGEVVVNATNGHVSLDVLHLAGAENLAGKVLIDLANPIEFGPEGLTLFVKDTDSLAEQIQRAFPDARVVKTLNTMNVSMMVNPGQLAEETSVFVSGNDEAAKATTTRLLNELGHDDVIDLGDITTARGTEMWLTLWIRLMQSLGTATFNLKIVR
ncbi:oxidoreductase [Nocardioides baekrokdamisoli]|uniref:Oxidoreductase n=1 Tax=Nocardioides baekrokdamisoli TaxID=1804624 RepID=A0A3G9J0C0_9ACTN|nr:NAD(P)-binding domain-containing protein [Nocardioides baekrokdamisoli]BBH16419.1 oxidoreductase [Nocardioides baekrokdamisoli]